MGSLLFGFAVLLGAASSAHAGTLSCGADFGGVIDGFDPVTFNKITSDNNLTLAIDSSCTIKNWPYSNGIQGFPATIINFYFPGGAQYYIVFDNVYYPGNMSCNNPQNSDFWIYWAPGSFNTISPKCQNFMVPVDAVKKQNPPSQTSASIGIPFTYTITAPFLGMLDSTGTFNYIANFDTSAISNVVITDDLTQGNTAALSYVNGTALAYSVDGAGNRILLGPVVTGASQAWLDAHPVSLTQPRLSDNTKHLVFSYENNPILATGVPAGYHIEIELQVVLDNNTTANTPGKTFTNTAGMWFDKTINGTAVTDLYGWPFTTPPMTIAAPNLVLTKSSPSTTINLGAPTNFTLNAQNIGGSDAYNTTVTDNLPAGMCTFDPRPSLTAQIFAADGVTPVSPLLVNNTDYQVSWNGGTAAACQLTVTMLDTAAARIGPTQRLIIKYQAGIDSTGVASGSTLTNVAGATQWFNGDSSYATRLAYNNTLSNGTPGTLDFQDAYTVTAALAGYYFQKSVQDLTTGASTYSTTSPLTVFPGDRLRYTLVLQNFTWPTLSNINISDDLGALNTIGAIVPGSLAIYGPGTTIPSGNLTFDPNGGTGGAGSITISGLTLLKDQQYQIQFDVTVGANLTNGSSVYNQANLTNAVDSGGKSWSGPSDDPYINGTLLLGAGGEDKTRVVIQAPGALSKVNPSPATATIGQQFSYRITVPATPANVPLYDVQLLDTLPANVSFVSAQVISGGTWSLSNAGSGSNLVIQDNATGIDIPAGGQAVIEVTVVLNNTTTNTSGVTYVNTATYKYNKINGDFATQANGTGMTTPNMTVVEPALIASKAVTNVTHPGNSAVAGDTLQYTVTILNNGDSPAYDVDVIDTLPSNVSLVAGSATATINGTLDTGFVATPTTLASGALVWGDQNGDNTLDIPVGQPLELTYQVTVLAANGTPITNNVYAAWTSLDGPNVAERTGAGCPTTTSPNIYCTGPVSVTVASLDPTTITKSVVSDSWTTDGSSDTDLTLRVGDTVVYSLTLNLREGVTQGVVVTDQLPPNLVFDSVVSINGVTASPYGSVAPFTYSNFTGPTVSGNTLTWNFGDITNAVDNNTFNNTFVIKYQAHVVNTLPQASTTQLTNNATLDYAINGTPATQKPASTNINVWQPVMSTPAKSATGFTSPANVNITTDHIPFTLQSCNSGQAPAYSAMFTDVLAAEMDEGSITAVSVTVGPLGSPVTLLGTEYTYVYDPATRTMTFVLKKQVNPNECATINYTIGFHPNVAPNLTWTNGVTLNEYWSLPLATGKQYASQSSALFTMTNPVTVTPLTKSVVSPASVVTIGEEAVYTITIPAANATLSNVVVTDPLNSALEYVPGSTTAVDDLGNNVALVDNSTASNVSLTIAQIPAGRQVTITIHTRVANNGAANAGTSFTNTASYTYTGMPAGSVTSGTSGSLTIVEPLVTINKTVANASAPGVAPKAGDVLTYTVTLTAPTGASYSTAYDLVLTDVLGTGLAYNSNSARINGTAVEPTVSGQTLTWPARNMNPGDTVTVTYDVTVDNSVTIGQALANSATARWTSLSGSSTFERNGSGTTYNDYFATSSTSLTVGDNTNLSKTRASDTFNAGDANVRVGDLIDYELRLDLQEGTTNGVVVTDVLPAGLVYDSFVSITPGSSNVTYTGNSQPTESPAGTLTWNLGTVVNAANGIATDDYLLIRYRARVLNNSALLPQTPVTQTLSNNASLNYTGATTPKPATLPIYVLQPMLAVTKSVVNTTGGDNIIDAGEVITYAVDIVNSGAAPAYDTVLTDALPVGLRQGGVTTTSITRLLNGTTTVTATYPTPLQPTFSSGIATWNFDTNVADAYTIPAGETLHVEYKVTADANLGPGLTLTNSAVASLYYSFDNNAVPSGNVANRQVYGPTNTSTTTLTTSKAGVLSKSTPKNTVAIGERFNYTISLPLTTTALQDVQIMDNLAATGADLRFVSATLNGVSLQNSGTDTNVVLGADGSIDIPANVQGSIILTVEVLNTANNMARGVTPFVNHAWYSYSNGVTRLGDDASTGADSNPVTIAHPDLTLTKGGPVPATMRLGVPGTFTLNVQNAGMATAWDVTVTDQLPIGMCTAPQNISVQVTKSTGPSPVTLVSGTDYTTGPLVIGTSNCTFTINGLSAAASIEPGQQLLITYQAQLDSGIPPNTALTNVAGATQWFSQDTPAGLATGETHTYTKTLDPATAKVALDFQDAYTITTEAPVLQVLKTVSNLTNPALGSNAKPGDQLHYTITVTNQSAVDVPNFSLTDDLGALNLTAVFEPGYSNLIAPSGGSVINSSSASGGTNGAPLISFSGLSLGGLGTSVTISFDVTLVPVIKNGTVVLNQGNLTAYGNPLAKTDDPNVGGAEDATRTVITAAPLMQVLKTSQDMTGDPAVLLPGDTLRYTIKVKNIGSENATSVTLSDLIPAFTTYVGGTTTLNGTVVTDPSTGVSPLQGSMLIKSPVDTVLGEMRADKDPAQTNNVAIITFDVKVNSNVLSGTIIDNQGFVNGSGIGSGPFAVTPSDDPNTVALYDPTRNIVGNVPLLDATKTVSFVDNNGNGLVDSGDTLHYTITVSNLNAVPATGVTLTDPGPFLYRNNLVTTTVVTTYVGGSTLLNGTVVADPTPGTSALIGGVQIGNLSAGANATVTFDAVINNTTFNPGDGISNQGYVTSTNLPTAEPTDADGDDSNGDQPTIIWVGSAQQLSIVKEVIDVNGGVVVPGDTLEYVVTVTNTGTVPATFVTVTDNLTLLNGIASFVNDGSATLDNSSTGVSYDAVTSTLTADYTANHGGDLAPGATTTLRFKVLLVNNSITLPAGYTVTNTAQVAWSSAAVTATASASIDIGAIPGTATLSGRAWHDVNLDFNDTNNTEPSLSGWTVELYQNGVWLGSTTTDPSGLYSFSGLAPTVTSANLYELRFVAPGAGLTTASLGNGDSAKRFTEGPQYISNIVAGSSSNITNLNLPIHPNGVVYDSVRRTPIAGATLTLTQGGSTVSNNCFLDPTQQNQVTLASGFYKFDLKIGDPSCPATGDYVINVTPPATGYKLGQTSSQIIKPSPISPYNVPTCSADAISPSPSAGGYCEALSLATVPTVTDATTYYLNLTLTNDSVADSQIFNNHIPLDPLLNNALTITKTSALVNVSRGQLVPYTITVNNTFGTLTNLSIVDTFPPGFKYVAGSSRIDGKPMEPVKTNREVIWSNLVFENNSQHTIKMLFIVGSGVSEGEYVNRAQVFDQLTGGSASGQASATVRVIPDPTFDCTDIIGKVFDDANRNGYQDTGEKGLQGVRVATTRGLLVTTDKYGRFHITCGITPDENRGSNFVMKVDDRTLPTGYRITTENPLVLRATRGKMMKFNFGATIHKVVRLDIANGVFEPGTSELRIQWKSRLDLLIGQLKKGPSILRIGYMAEVEDEDLVEARVKAMKDEVARRWSQENGDYQLEIETEVFWRTGAPPDRSALK